MIHKEQKMHSHISFELKRYSAGRMRRGGCVEAELEFVCLD